MPAVSVIIPTCNRAPLLRRAVTSVLNQTVNDFEIVIGDDASRDGTSDMIAALDDPRITCLRHPDNRGASAARNTAIAHATGEYVAFLDDDDEWLPDKLQCQLERMQAVPCSVGVICCGHYEVDSLTGRILGEMKPSLRGRISEQLLIQGFFNHTSTMLVRSECFRRVGVFDPSLRFGEDLDMWVRLAQEYEFDFVEAPLVKLHFQPTGLSRDFSAIISGAEMHLLKYRDFFARHPSVHADRLYRLGTFYCFVGDLHRGRVMFRRAIALNRGHVKSYLGLALSWSGREGFKRGHATKNWLGELVTDLRPPVGTRDHHA